MGALIDKTHICDMIDGCISDLKDNKAGKLSDLASLLRSLSVATKNEVFTITYPTLGSFGSIVTDYKKMILLAPMLTSDEKSKYRGIFDDVVKHSIEALNKFKIEVSKEGEPDYKEVIIANAMITEGWVELADNLKPFRISRGSS